MSAVTSTRHRAPEGRLRQAMIGVSVATVASGAMQMVAPGMVLKRLDASLAPADRHFFATIGMFMVASGGVLLDDLRRHEDDPTVLLWAALQKFGAAAAVALGVKRGVFSPRALLVASFDAFSGAGCLAYRSQIHQRRGPVGA